jgi:hypothetical protein
MTLKAAAAPKRPASVWDRICTVMRFQSAETRKIAALMAVMARTKENVRPEKKAGTMRGRVTRRKVAAVVAPRSAAHQDTLLSQHREQEPNLGVGHPSGSAELLVREDTSNLPKDLEREDQLPYHSHRAVSGTA